MLRLCIVGPGRSGKDVAAEWLVANTTLRYGGPCSWFIASHIASQDGVTREQAYAARHRDVATRERWRAAGDKLREQDPAALARASLADGDLVVGVRAAVEMAATRCLTDFIIWIDRPGIPDDPTLEFGEEVADVILPNRWGLAEYHERLKRLATALGIVQK